MLHLAAVLAISTSLALPDTSLLAFATDTVVVVHPSGMVAPHIEPDTVRPRRKAVEIDENYDLRLRIHRYASYTTVPLFALQTIAGNQLYVNGGKEGAPDWAKTTHSLGAFGLGALFTINTVTGGWNLWSSRDQTEGRTKRIIHSVLMLASDAGFLYTGTVLADDANRSSSARADHRNWAYASMGTALVGYGIMLIGNN